MDRKNRLYLSTEFQYCMHACGSIYNQIFTNSLEAFEYWHSQGIKLFEIDIDEAERGKYVACHDYNKETFIKMEIENLPQICNFEWFKRQKLFGKSTMGLTSITLRNIFELLAKYKDVCFMIDPKIYSFEDVCLLLESINKYIEIYHIDSERIVFETYTEDMIRATQEYKDLVQYQFCIEDERKTEDSDRIRRWDINKLVEFLKQNNIWIISYPWKYAVENLINLKKLKDEGFIIFSRTKNDILSDLLKQTGININIIDYLVTDEQRDNLLLYKQVYYKEYKEKIDNIFFKK